MNRDLMEAHIAGATHIEDINPVLAEDNSNISMFFMPDVVGNKRFAQNYGGYPRSEIAEINAAANMQQQMNLLQQLQDYSPSDNPNAGMSDSEIMLGHRSKYCQTATEQVEWLEGQIERRRSERVAAEMKAENSIESKISFEDNQDS